MVSSRNHAQPILLLIFGTISAGDASHYGLTIIALNTVDVGEYSAKLRVWGRKCT